MADEVGVKAPEKWNWANNGLACPVSSELELFESNPYEYPAFISIIRDRIDVRFGANVYQPDPVKTISPALHQINSVPHDRPRTKIQN